MQKELDPEGARQHRRLTSRPKSAEVKAALHGRMATDLAEKQTVKILDFASSRLDNYRAEDEPQRQNEGYFDGFEDEFCRLPRQSAGVAAKTHALSGGHRRGSRRR